MHKKIIFCFSKQHLLYSAKTCFIPNHTLIRIKQEQIRVPLATIKESSLTPDTIWQACDIRLAVPEVINIYSSQLVSGDWIASA